MVLIWVCNVCILKRRMRLKWRIKSRLKGFCVVVKVGVDVCEECVGFFEKG